MTRLPSWYLGGGALLAGGVLVAGCGGGGNGLASDSASQILQAVTSAVRSAKSVTLNGTETKGTATMTINATIFANGDFNGTVAEGGTSAQLIKIGSNDYVNAGAAYYTAQGSTSASLAAKLAGKWIEVPDSEAGVGNLFSFSSLSNQLLSQAGTVTKGTTSTIDGESAVSILSSKQGTIWVATSGTAFPLEVLPLASEGTGQISFTDWNQGSEPTPPAGAEPASSFGTGATGTSGSIPPAGSTGTSGSVPPAGTSGSTGVAPASGSTESSGAHAGLLND